MLTELPHPRRVEMSFKLKVDVIIELLQEFYFDRTMRLVSDHVPSQELIPTRLLREERSSDDLLVIRYEPIQNTTVFSSYRTNFVRSNRVSSSSTDIKIFRSRCGAVPTVHLQELGPLCAPYSPSVCPQLVIEIGDA